MRIFTVETEYSLSLNNSFSPSIRRDISIHGPVSIGTNAEHGCAAILNTNIAAIDNKQDLEYPESVVISKKKIGKQRFSGFLKVLHVNEKNFVDKDEDLVVHMYFSEHHDTSNYPAYFSASTVIDMLQISWEDVITLGYYGDGEYIRYLVFVMRNNHRTKGILGGEECLYNELGKLQTVEAS